MRIHDLFEMTAGAFSQIRRIFQSNFDRRRLQLDLPAHAFDRAVEGERGKDITEEYLISAFQQMLKKFDNKEPGLMKAFEEAQNRDRDQPGVQVTFKFPVEDTFLNFPVVIKFLGGGRFRFTLKTVMVKKDFKPYKNDIVVNL